MDGDTNDNHDDEIDLGGDSGEGLCNYSYAFESEGAAVYKKGGGEEEIEQL